MRFVAEPGGRGKAGGRGVHEHSARAPFFCCVSRRVCARVCVFVFFFMIWMFIFREVQNERCEVVSTSLFFSGGRGGGGGRSKRASRVRTPIAVGLRIVRTILYLRCLLNLHRRDDFGKCSSGMSAGLVGAQAHRSSIFASRYGGVSQRPRISCVSRCDVHFMCWALFWCWGFRLPTCGG